MNTIFRKVSVEERLPKDGMKGYVTNCGIFIYNGGWHNGDTSGVEWWLEEIKLPAQSEIESEMKKRCTSSGGFFNGADAKWFNRGARWALSFVLVEKSVGI